MNDNYGPYRQNWKSYSLFGSEENEWNEFWGKTMGSLECLQNQGNFQNNQNDEKIQETIQKLPAAANSPKPPPEATSPVPTQYKHLNPKKAGSVRPPISSKTSTKNTHNKPVSHSYIPKKLDKPESVVIQNVQSFVPYDDSKKKEECRTRKAVHIKIEQLPPVKSMASTSPILSPKNIADQLSAKALIQPKTSVSSAKLEEKKPVVNAKKVESWREKPMKAAESAVVIPDQSHQLALKGPCVVLEENFVELELSFKDIVQGLSVNQAKQAIDIFLQPNFKENLEEISSLAERRRVYIHLIMLCGQAYQEKKDPDVAKKLLKVHSTLIDQFVIQNEITFIQLLYPVVEGAIDSFDSELKCLGVDMLTDYFSFKPKKIGKEKDLLEKFLLKDLTMASPVILKKRERLEDVFFPLLPQISYEKIALKIGHAKHALPYLLVWLRKFQKESCNWNASDEECFNHLLKFMEDFSKDELIRVFDALAKVNLTLLKQKENAFNCFQDLAYNYFSRRFSVTSNNTQEQKDVLISFCKNLDKISPQAISNLKFSLEKLCDSIHSSFSAETLHQVKLEQNESPKVPSAALIYFISIINAMIHSPSRSTEIASGVKGKRKGKPAVKVSKRIEDNPNASFAINQIFDHLLSNLPEGKEEQKAVFEAILKLSDDASHQFNFVNSCSQYLLRYIQCYALDLPFLESVMEYKQGVLDPIIDFTQVNRHAWEVYFNLNKGEIPFEVIKSCIRVIELDRLKPGLTKAEQNNLLSNFLAILRTVLASKISNSEKQNLIDYPIQGLIHLPDVDASLKEELETVFLSSYKLHETSNFSRLIHLYKLEAFLFKQVIPSKETIVSQADVPPGDELIALKHTLNSFAEEKNLMSVKHGIRLINLHKKNFEGRFSTLVEFYKLLFDSIPLEKNSIDLLLSWIHDDFLCKDSIFSTTGNRNRNVLVKQEDKEMQAQEQKAHREFVDFLISQYILACKELIKENPKKQKTICENFIHNLEGMAKRHYLDVYTLEDFEFLNKILEDTGKFFREYRISELCRSCFDDFCDALKKRIGTPDFLDKTTLNQILTKLNKLGI